MIQIILCVCSIGTLPITPGENGTHTRKSLVFPKRTRSMKNPSARSHPCKLGTSKTSPSFPFCLTPKRRLDSFSLRKSLRNPISWQLHLSLPTSYALYDKTPCRISLCWNKIVFFNSKFSIKFESLFQKG